MDAQQTRRVLDRLVGYEISPLLWDKVRRGLSAGRVQTVALRLIVDRENEIKAFQPVEYWPVDARLKPAGGKQEFTARLHTIDGTPRIGRHRRRTGPAERRVCRRLRRPAWKRPDGP